MPTFITCTIDLGMVDLETIRQRAYAVGASNAVTVDGRETLVSEFLWPALRAGAIYEGQYPWRRPWAGNDRPVSGRCCAPA